MQGRQPEGPLSSDFEVVIGEADDAVEERGHENHPHEDVGEVSPEEGGEHHGNEDQEPPCRWRAFLGLVGKRSLGSDLLPDLELPQPLDQARAQGKADQQRREGRQRRPERDVPENVQDLQVVVQRIEEVIEHQWIPSGPAGWPAAARIASTTRSIRMPRDPFTRTTSPDRRAPATNVAAASESGRCRTSLRPAARALRAARPLLGPTATKRSMPDFAASVPTCAWARAS